jgi:hypothetical protein
MSDEKDMNEQECCKPRNHYHRGSSGAVYGLGFIGACVYFIGNAATFWLGVLGFLKALVWPAMLVYAALKYLNIQ